MKARIVERQNILPFVYYTAGKEKLTRREVIEKIIIANEDRNDRPATTAILILFWLTIASFVAGGIFLFYYY